MWTKNMFTLFYSYAHDEVFFIRISYSHRCEWSCNISLSNFIHTGVIKLKRILWRSSHHRYSVKKGVLRNFAKFTGKHLCQRVFFNKVAGLRPSTLLKKKSVAQVFPIKHHFKTEKVMQTACLIIFNRNIWLRNTYHNFRYSTNILNLRSRRFERAQYYLINGGTC